ncbi:choice-of-anchor A domain-containing protein [Asanoa hainanensis]|uniref:Choice-of-anchor A domain-containing protein n=1 Tax=Asanoa hainanensis TaxID=560556 RepID=A0A239I9B5_9ACTN|nr:choice-of-anchor A family protein [Asanoa hainanensis]SNS90139.1 choice-of-anchor A domain-containing protein [Asanoa hainanensis]
MARKARWLAATAVGAVAAGASLWMLTPATAAGPVNPVEGGLGFLVLVEREASLTGIESEGPVAIGGDLTFGSAYRIATERDVRVGVGASPLVVGGRALIGAPKVVDAKVFGDGVGVVLRANDPAGPVPGARKTSLDAQEALDFAGVFATFRERSQQLDTCAETVKLRNSGGGALDRPISTPGTRAYVSLTPNQTNVLNLTGDEFNNLSDLTFNTQPSAETPLLVNVGTGADYEWRTANFAGISDEQAPYILMNFPDATTITQVGADTAEGTIYAPNAAFTDVNSANNEGNLVVRSYTHGTPAAGGGETHDLPFNTTVQCGAAAADTPVTAPPATTEPVAAASTRAGVPVRTWSPTPGATVSFVEPPIVGEIPTDPAVPTDAAAPSKGATGAAAPTGAAVPDDPAPMDSKLPWAWPTDPRFLPQEEPSSAAAAPTEPAGTSAAGAPSAAPVLPGEAPVLPGEPAPAEEPAANGDPADDGVAVEPGDDNLPYFPTDDATSPTATPSGATPAPSGSTEPAVVANYGPLPGQGGAEGGEELTRPSTVRLVIAGLSILVVSAVLLLLGRRRKRRHAL